MGFNTDLPQWWRGTRGFDGHGGSLRQSGNQGQIRGFEHCSRKDSAPLLRPTSSIFIVLSFSLSTVLRASP